MMSDTGFGENLKAIWTDAWNSRRTSSASLQWLCRGFHKLHIYAPDPSWSGMEIRETDFLKQAVLAREPDLLIRMKNSPKQPKVFGEIKQRGELKKSRREHQRPSLKPSYNGIISQFSLTASFA